jgi:hypothetical protein
MKNTIRVRKNRSAATSAPQAKTPPAKTVTVIFYSVKDDEEMFRVELPDVLYAAILRASEKMKITPGRFFELAVEHKIAREKSTSATGGAK